MEGRWTIRWQPFTSGTLGGYKVGGTEPWPGEEPTPVVPCDDAAIERVALWLFARSFVPQMTVERVRPLWDLSSDETREYSREAAREAFSVAAGETT